jgi:heat shock protein HtpX
MAMMISRKREFLADASAAELTRNPLALASALEKLENASEPTKTIKRGIAHLCVVDPMGKPINEKEGFWAELFATHPPMKKRIQRLQSMGYQYTSQV